MPEPSRSNKPKSRYFEISISSGEQESMEELENQLDIASIMDTMGSIPPHGVPQHNSHQQRSSRRPRNAVHGAALPTERRSLADEAKLEMSSIPGKTPVSVLQELLSRRGVTPKYELVQIEGAIHEPIFRYRVCINNDYVATGTGRSKKDAKHAAARNLLDLVVGKQTPEQANQANGGADLSVVATGPSTGPGSAGSFSEDKVMGNPIGWLQEMCMSRRWPPPYYEMEHEEGLPHEREFTISCIVLRYREVGTGKSKKLAKRVAAHRMWQMLQVLPVEGAPHGQPGTYDEDDEISGKGTAAAHYAGLKDSKIPTLTTNHSHKVSHFHKSLKNSTGDKLSELQTVSLNSRELNFVQFLQEIATEQEFEVTYVDIEERSLSGQHQCLVQLSSLPVAVCYGSGPSSKDAQAAAAQNALEYLRIMTKK